MDSGGPKGRTYNEKEIGTLIQRASEIHERAAGATERNLSLEEIGQIAADLGLPIKHLQAAAMELESDPVSQKRFSLTGAPFAMSESRVADGVMSSEEWDEIILALQQYSGSLGKTNQVGSARIWTHVVGEGTGGFNFEKTQVTIRPADDHTSVQVKLKYDGAVAMYAASFFFTSFITLMIAHSLPDVGKLAELGIAGLGGLSSLGVVRGLIAAGARRQKEKLSKMADRLAQILDRGTAESKRRRKPPH